MRRRLAGNKRGRNFVRQVPPLHNRGGYTVKRQTEQIPGQLMLAWMRLLGWKLEIDAGHAVGEHVTEAGERLVVRAHGESTAELACSLFEQAMAALEGAAASPARAA
jgi:hypothetical protein